MRTKNSVINIIVSVGMGIFALAVTFVTQRVFVNTLGVNYLGVNGLFNSIISMLSIAELGLGSAIVYHLYKPMEGRDEAKVNALMAFYRRGYHAVACFVFAVGLVLLPFLSLIVGKSSVSANLSIVYMLFIADAVFSYLLSYKRSILYADQKNYIINAARVASMLVLNTLQVVLLLTTKNYYLYLMIKIVMTLVENIFLNTVVDKRYPFLDSQIKNNRLDKATRKDVLIKVKGLLYHKAGSFFILGTDNIVITTFLGIGTVGMYSNYLLILTAINSMYSQLSAAITASIGNLLLVRDSEKHFSVYERINFASFWTNVLLTVGFLVTVDSFIKLWLGEHFILPIGVLIALSLNLYLTLSRLPLYSFKTAAGIFHEDRFVPIIESVVNIVASITLLHFFGLAGVFMGTICSALVVLLYSYPKFVYTRLFDLNAIRYFKEFTKHLGILIFISATTFLISRAIHVDKNIIQLAVNLGLCIVVPNLILAFVFGRSKELRYYKQLVVESWQGMRKKTT